MPLNESQVLETNVECFHCRILVDSRSVFTTETKTHFCLTCWLEKSQSRLSYRRLTIVEL